jgi:hypothetical protein
MGAASADDAFFLLNSFLRNDRHYLSNSRSYGDRGPAALKRAIKLFLRRPSSDLFGLHMKKANQSVFALFVTQSQLRSAGW